MKATVLMPASAMCSAMASDIMMSFCGVLKTHLRFGSMGSRMRGDAAVEIIGVRASATTSIRASEFGVMLEPRMMSTLLSLINFPVFFTAVLALADQLAGVVHGGRGVRRIVEHDVVNLLAGDAARHQRHRVFLGNAQRGRRAGGRQRDADMDVGQGLAAAQGGRQGQGNAGEKALWFHGFVSLDEMAADEGGSCTATTPPKNRSATIGAMVSCLSSPSGLSKVKMQLIIPNSSIVSALVRPAASVSGRICASALAKAATTARSLFSTSALSSGWRNFTSSVSTRWASRACAYSCTKRSINARSRGSGGNWRCPMSSTSACRRDTWSSAICSSRWYLSLK